MAQPIDQLPLDRLGSYLAAQIPGFGSLEKAEKFEGGQSNPTFLLTASSGRYVLRRKPPGEVLPSAHAVDREYRVMQALAATRVPVPRMRVLCADDDVIGSMFYVMDFLDGNVYWDAPLQGFANADRAAMYDRMNAVLADLHQVDVAAVGLADFGKPGNYFERQCNRWVKQYRASETERIEAMETLMEWLPGRMPADDGRVALIHGDYRLDNLMFAKDRPEIIAVLDWELSTLGHPFSDIAYQCMQLRIPANPDLGNLGGLGGLDRRALGIPSEEEYVARYCERMGLDGIPDWSFYLGFSFFRFAAILQGIMNRYQDGTASSTQALTYGKMTRPMAEMAVDFLREQGEL
ncbi:MAG: phosphotransferase family protein [Pseudomonadales bacterium]|nr:phosphotransferase family protein [Pseudomonadales bacterium]